MKHLRLLLASTLTLIVVVVSACSIGGNTVNKKLWWDGSLPFEQRRSIEEFENHIENTLGEFAYTYSANTGPISVYVPSNLRHCGEEGFELFTAAIAFAPPFDHDDMINAVTHTFTPWAMNCSPKTKTTSAGWTKPTADTSTSYSSTTGARAS